MSGRSGTFYPVASLPDTNARQLATTIRVSSTALLTIDSEDRYTDFIQSRQLPTSPYNFTISKSESLMPGFMTRIGISEVNFPWSIPNINRKSQSINIAYYTSGALVEAATLTIPVGFYTPAEIAAGLQADIRDLIPAAAGFTMTYGQAVAPPGVDVSLAGDCPQFIYATNNLTDTIAFTPMTPNTVAYPYSAASKQLFDVLGFTNANSVNGGVAYGYGQFTLCQSIRYVDIVCNQLTNSQSQKDQTSQTVARDMLCRIYLGSGAGDGQSIVQPSSSAFSPPGCAPTTIYRNFTVPKQIQWLPNQNIPGFLQFQVYDDTGDLLDIALGIPGFGDPLIPARPGSTVGQFLDWSMTMLVSEN